MVDHIFAENSNMRETGLFGYPKLLLRLNEEFKDMGFKRVEHRPNIDKTTFKRELTLMIKPIISGWNTYSIDLKYGNETEQKFSYLLKGKKGYAGTLSYNRLGESEDEPREKIIYKWKTRITREEREIIIGEYLHERNIVILYPNLFRSDLALFDKNEFLFFFVDFLKQWIKKHKIKKVSVSAKLQETMFKQFRQYSKERIGTFKNSISEGIRNIKKSQEQIIKLIKENQEKKVIIEGLEKLMDTTIKDLKREINLIKKLPFVKSVRLTSNGVSVEVKDVRINYENQEVKMGDYTINILPNNFTIVSKTPINRGEGNGDPIHHPHIDDNGSICFGNRRDKIQTLLAEMKFSKLVYFLYLYLKSYNPRDKYFPISWWTKGESDGN